MPEAAETPPPEKPATVHGGSVQERSDKSSPPAHSQLYTLNPKGNFNSLNSPKKPYVTVKASKGEKVCISVCLSCAVLRPGLQERAWHC